MISNHKISNLELDDIMDINCNSVIDKFHHKINKQN